MPVQSGTFDVGSDANSSEVRATPVGLYDPYGLLLPPMDTAAESPYGTNPTPVQFEFGLGMPNGEYIVQARADKESGSTTYYSAWSAPSAVASGSTDSNPVNVTDSLDRPVAPTGVSATTSGMYDVTVTWSYSAESVIGGYVVYGINAEGQTEVAGFVNDPTITTCTFTPPSDAEQFLVLAYGDGVNKTGPSPYSNIVANPLASDTAPTAPNSLRGYWITGSSPGAQLIWDNVPNNEDGYYIERKDGNSATWTTVGTVGPDVTSYFDSTATETPLAQYAYQIVAFNAAGSSPPSNIVLFQLPQCITCGGVITASGVGQASTPELSSSSGDGASTSVDLSNASALSQGNAGVASDSGRPHLEQTVNDGIAVFDGPTDEEAFNYSSGSYSEALGGTDSLADSSGVITFTDASGNRTTFNDFSASVAADLQGTLISQTDADGNSSTVASTNSSGDPTEIDVENASSTISEKWIYAYISSGVNAGLLYTVTQEELISSTWTPERVMTYSYYEGSYYTSDGSAGDLESVVTSDGSGNTLDESYYRYYVSGDTGGAVHDVKYSFGADSYARLEAVYSTPNSATSTEVAPYADSYFVYDSSNRVTSETLQGAGCSACSAGLGTTTFAYTTSSNSAGENSWATKVVATDANSNENITYYNAYGQTMLSVFDNVAASQMSGTFYEYDSAGHQILMADPSAVDLPSSLSTIEGYSDLLHNVSGSYAYLGSTGQIDLTDFYSSTTATSTTAGGVSGYEEDTKVEDGQGGTVSYLTGEDYFADSAGSSTIYPQADSIAYRNGVSSLSSLYDSSAAPEVTSYSYSFYSGTTQMKTQAVTNPAITTGQNGSGSSFTTETIYDTFGRAVWTVDGNGYIGYTEYDPLTGAVLESITDVNPSTISSPSVAGPTRSSSLPAALNLTTTYVVDSLGRTTKMTDPNGNVTYTVYDDPDQAVFTFPGATETLSGGNGTLTTTGPIEMTRSRIPYSYTIGSTTLEGTYDETLTFSGTVTVTSNQIVLPGFIRGNSASSGFYNVLNLVGSGSPQYTIQSLSRDLTNNAGQTIESDAYATISNTTYLATAPGSPYSGSKVTSSNLSGNYDATLYGYDALGNQNRVVSPMGTITRTVYDGQSRVISTWTGDGTDDTPSTGYWSTTNAGTMVMTSQSFYDYGGVGDGNLTESVQYSDTNPAHGRASLMYYDFRDRLVAEKDGAAVNSSNVPTPSGETDNQPITINSYDNLDEVTETDKYDGETVSFPATAGSTLTTPSSSLLIAEAKTSYDNLGQVFQTQSYSVNPSSGAVSSTALTSEMFYDGDGNTIESVSPQGLATKTYYDGADRPTFTFDTDGGALNNATYAGTRSAAGSVAGDVVLSQTQNVYDADGNVIETISTDRDDTDSNAATGALGQGPLAGFPDSFVLPAGSSPTGAALTMTWLSNIPGANSAGYASNLTANIGSSPSSGTAVWIIPPATAGGSSWAFDIRDSAGHYFGGVYGTASGSGFSSAGSLTGTAQSGWTAIETVSGIGAQPPAGFPSSFNVSAGNSPTGSALTMTWESSISSMYGGLGGGYTSNTSADIEGPLSSTTVWILPPSTAYNFSGDSENLTGSNWAFNVQDSSGDYIEGNYDAGVSPFAFASADITSGASEDVWSYGAPSGWAAPIENVATGQSPQAYGRVGYTASFYDSADRDVADVNVGTNGGTPWTLPGSVPSRSDTVLVSSTTYNSAGEVATVTDPRGIVAETLYDALGRTTETIADYTTGTPTDSSNQTVTYAYDGDNNMISETAVMPSGETSQTTDYIYGVSVSGGSGIDSTDLLAKTEYPDSTGGASSSASYDETYEYDELGETTQMTDRDATTHAYTYDDLGRETLDDVTSFGSGVDATVKELAYSYNNQGLPYQQTSYNSSSTVLNQVEDVYNGLGQLTNQYQADGGSVNTSTSPDANYSYGAITTGSRLLQMTYPNGRILHYGYNNSTLDNAIGRVDYLADDNGSGSAGQMLEEYTYLGLDTIVSEMRPQAQAELSLSQQAGDTLASTVGGDQYTGLNQFGEIIDQNWVDTTGANGPSDDRFQYAYDRDGNVLYERNRIASSMSELFHANSSTSGDNNTAYDGLNRLVSFTRGNLSSSGNNGSSPTPGYLDKITTTSSTHIIGVTLDANGNPEVITTTTTGGASPEDNTFSTQNEETNYNGVTLSYDNNGNALNDQNSTTYTYDAWNRQVSAITTDYQKETYTFSALGQRITQVNSTVVGTSPAVLQINDGNVQRSMIDSLTVIFSSSVTLSGTPFTLMNGSTSIGLSVSGSGTTYTITFTGSTDISYGSLIDGEYTFSINHSDVSGISGFTSNQTFTFHRLYGDFLGTGTVTAADFSLFDQLYGHSCPSADWYFDYDGDGYIASYDFVEFADNYGKSASAPDSGAIFSPTTETDFYYSSMGQIIQEDSVSSGVSTLSMQYVWGEAYVNELILRDSNADGDTSTGNLGKSGSGLEQRLYALQDANYDITSLVDTTGTVQQRMLYDAWGNPTYTDSSYDVTGNGYNFAYGWQGGRTDPVTGLITFNATGNGRTTYDPTMHTWLQPDNGGYVDSMNRYQMERGNPVDALDPTGLDELGDNRITSISGHATRSDDVNQLLTPYQGSFIANRGVFRIGVGRIANDTNVIAAIRFYPNEIAKTKCTRIALVQIGESYKAFWNFAFFWGLHEENPDVIDAPEAAGNIFAPYDDNNQLVSRRGKQGEQYIFDSSGGLPYAEMTDKPGSDDSTLDYVAATFRTYAIATEGKERGHSYGYVRWGVFIDKTANMANVWVDGMGAKGFDKGAYSGFQSINLTTLTPGPLTVTPHPGDLASQTFEYTSLQN